MNFLVLIEIAGFPRACHIYIYIRDSQLNRPASVSLASLARQLWYVQYLFL